MRKVIGTIFITVYAVVAIAVTILLLSYNDYSLSEIGGKTLYIVQEDIDSTYERGQLLVIDKSSQSDINIGDEVFLYQVISDSSYEVVLDKVTDIEKVGTKSVYYFEGENQYYIDSIIGKVENTAVYDGIGTVLGILESRLGYLFLVVIVTLILFLQELFELVMELKYGDEEPERS